MGAKNASTPVPPKHRRTTIKVFALRETRAPIDGELFDITHQCASLFLFEPKEDGAGTKIRLAQQQIPIGATVHSQAGNGEVTSVRRENGNFILQIDGLYPSDLEGMATMGMIQVLQ